MGKPTEDHDGDDEIEISDGKTNKDDLDDEDGQEEDRGDVVNPEETDENLSKLAKEDEDEEEEADEQPEDDAKTGGKIPKGRFNEVNEKRIRAEERARLLEEENARLRGGKKDEKADDQQPVDLKALRKQQRAALMEGDEDKAAELDEQIDAEMQRRAVLQATATISEQQVRSSLAEAGKAVIADYPFLNSQSPKANKEAIADTIMYRDRYMREGMTPADALLKAAEKVGKVYAPAKKMADPAEDEDDDKGAEQKGKPSRIDELRAARLKKNATAANNQPARLDGGVGNRGTGGKVNIEDMDDDQFRTLSEREKAKLRGDIV